MYFIGAWLNLLLFIVSFAAWDHYKERQGIAIHHGWNAFWRVLFGILLIWAEGIYQLPVKRIAYFAAATFLIYWALFNLVKNKFDQLPWDYLGTRAWLDKLERLAPLPIFYLRILAGVSMVIIFYEPDPWWDN